MSTRVTCRDCHAGIPADDINISEGVAFCRACGSLSRLADLLNDDSPLPLVDLDDPPRGCRIRDNGVETVVRAGARSIGSSVGTLFAAVFWNGIVSVFVLIAISGTIHHLFGNVPSWFPAPNFNSGSNSMPLGMVLFLWVFLLPFIAVGLMLASAFLTCLFGRCEVRLRHNRGVAFTGFGPIGWKRPFDATEVKSVHLGKTTWTQNDEKQPVVVIEANKTIRIGSILPDDRRAWLAAVLRKLLVV